MSAGVPTVFVNHRSADSGWAAALVHEELERTFGEGFLDVRSIPPGGRYPDELRAGIDRADVLLVLIGDDWLGEDEHGVRLVDRTRDWVREEIEQALARGILIVPVVLGDTELPSGSDLPPSIQELPLRQAVRLTRQDPAHTLTSLMRGLAAKVPELLLGRLLEPERPAGRSPGALLVADRAVVRFERPDDALDRLLDWANSPAGVALRLVTGPAGGGKTRLAGELSDRLRKAGWVAGPAADPLPGSLLRQAAGAAPPILLVLDEAETRAADVLDLAAAAADAAAARIRLLLVARSAGPWLRPLRRSVDERVLDLVADMAEQPLPPLAVDHPARRAEFRRAAAAYAERLGLASVPPEPDDLGTELYAQALDIHAAALAAVLAADGNPLHGSPFRALLARETAYQERTAAGLPDPHPDRLEQVLAAATLFAAESEDEACRLLAAVPALAGTDAATVLRYVTWVRDLYPGPRFLHGPRPRPLAEELVAAHLAVLPGCAAVAAPGQVRYALRFLGGAALRRPGLDGPLSELVRADPAARLTVAVEEAARLPDGSALLRAVTDVLADDPAAPDLVGSVLDRLPDRSASLGPYAVELVRLALSGEGVSGGRKAYLEGTLAARLCEVGEWADAVAAGERAVSARRALLSEEETRLAADLTNLALARRHRGDAGGELSAATEAVTLLRRGGPAADRGLVKALLRLAEAEPTKEDRVARAREAVTVAGRLPEDRDPLLPAALEALGTSLPADDPEAAAVLADAVNAYRRLAIATPDPYRGELARALLNLAGRAASRGDLAGARAAATEAAELAVRDDPRHLQIRSAALDLLHRLDEF